MISASLFSAIFLLLSQGGSTGELHRGTPVQGIIRTGILPAYDISLNTGDVAQVVLDQGGTDLIVTVILPSGESSEVDTREAGPEPFVIAATVPGRYRLEVRTVKPSPRPETFHITLQSIRPMVPQDRLRLKAQHDGTVAKKADLQRSSATLSQGVMSGADALAAWRELGDREAEAAELAELGTLHLYMGKVEDARLELLEAIPIARTASAPWIEAEALTNVGLASTLLFDHRDAAQRLLEALTLWRDLGGRYSEAAALNNLGLVYTSTGSYQQAARCFKQSLAITISLGDLDHEGYAHLNLARVFSRLADTRAAIDSFHRAIALFKKAGDHHTEAIAMLQFSDFYFASHWPGPARTLARKSLALFMQANSHDDVARAWKKLGDISASRRHDAVAQHEYDQALASYKLVASRVGEASVLASLGELYTHGADYPRAEQYLQQARAIFQSVKKSSSEAGVLLALGAVYKSSGQNEEAIHALSEAVAVLSPLGTPASEAKVLFELALAERSANRLNDAQIHIERVLEITENLRALVSGPQLRISYIASKSQYYELAWEIYLQLDRERPGEGYAERALEAVERSRGRALLDSIDEANSSTEETLGRELKERSRHLTEDLNFWSERLQDASTRENVSKHKQAEERLGSLLAEYRQLESDIRDSDPRYALLSPRPLRVTDMRTDVLDPQTVLLEYALGAQHSYLWAVTLDSTSVFELPAKQIIEAEVTRFYKSMMLARQQSGARAQAGVRASAAALSRMLLWPASALIGGKRLLIVGDSFLARLPFSGLPSPESGMPVVVDHEVVFAPSTSVIAERRRISAKMTLKDRSVAVVADPVFDSGDARMETPVRQVTPRFARLPFTRSEANAILSLAHGREVLRAFDFAADRALFTSNRLHQYGILHIATHAVTDVARPELSALVFSLVDRRGTTRNGYLRLYEIASLRLDARLVTLSACGTGQGKSIPGEGTIGLAWGFLNAGAATVVVSLWEVEDQATEELMRLFYSNMFGKRQLPPSAALRAAQIAVMRTHPWTAYTWSGWFVIGDWR